MSAGGRPVLLKRFDPVWVPSGWSLEDLRARALVQWKLDDPGILRPLEYRLSSHGLTGIFEEPAGVKLSRLLQKTGPLAARAAGLLGIQLAAALAAAHRMGIYHGSLSAASVWVAPNGALKVTDFDIGSLRAAGGRPLPDPTPAGDLRLLGLLLYLMATGREPSQDGAPEPPGRVYAGVRPELEAAVMGILGGDPPRPEMEGVVEALRAATAGLPAGPFPWPRSLTAQGHE
jgi:serine/threonine-protein kinase